MIDLFKTFLVAVKYASFSVAASQLGITRTAVGKQIKKLEDTLGCDLFTRLANGVALTAQGKEIRDAVEQLVRQYDHILARTQHGKVAGKFKIGAFTTVQIGLLPVVLASIEKKFPLAEIQIILGLSSQFLEMIERDEIDMAVMIEPPMKLASELHWTPLLQEPYALIVPPEWKENPVNNVREILLTYKFIRYNKNSYGGRQIVEYLKKNKIAVVEGMQFDEPAVILKMVSQGLGVSILPAWLTLDCIRTNVHVIPLERKVYRRIGILQHIRKVKSPLSIAFIETLEKEVAAIVQRMEHIGVN